MEAIWCGSLGLLHRCGGFGGLRTAGKDIFLPPDPEEPAGEITAHIFTHIQQCIFVISFIN